MPGFNVQSLAAPQLSFVSSSALALGRWYHLAGTFTYNSSTNTEVGVLYVNGERVANSTVINSPYNYQNGGTTGGTIGNEIRMGETINEPPPPATIYYMNGYLDEVAIYSQALTFSQIQQLYAQGAIKHQLAVK